MKVLPYLCALMLMPSMAMALTEHEKFHLNAIIKSQEDDKKDSVMMSNLAAVKGKTGTEYSIYLDGIKTEVNKILLSGVFPVGLEPADIHDYLEDKE